MQVNGRFSCSGRILKTKDINRNNISIRAHLHYADNFLKVVVPSNFSAQ